jgi:hypothetical protein
MTLLRQFLSGLALGIVLLPTGNASEGEAVGGQTAWSRLYAGTIEGQPAVALLEFNWIGEAPHSFAGRYYYLRDPSSRALVMVPGSRLLLECPADPLDDEGHAPLLCPAPSGTWDISVNVTSLMGTRIAPDGSRQPIHLERRPVTARVPPIKVPAGSNPRAWREVIATSEAYQAALATDVDQHARDHAERFGVSWETVREPLHIGEQPFLTTRITLVQSPNAAARARINEWLAKNITPTQRSNDCGDFPCISGNLAEVKFADDHLLAVAGSNYVEGGAHPSWGSFAVTFDLQTGDIVNWSDRLGISDQTDVEGPLYLSKTNLLSAQVLRLIQDPKNRNGCFVVVAQHYACRRDESCERRPTSRGSGTVAHVPGGFWLGGCRRCLQRARARVPRYVGGRSVGRRKAAAQRTNDSAMSRACPS